MKLFKNEEVYGENILVALTPDEYGMLCKFMKDNAVGYGPGRTIANKWRDARNEFKGNK